LVGRGKRLPRRNPQKRGKTEDPGNEYGWRVLHGFGGGRSSEIEGGKGRAGENGLTLQSLGNASEDGKKKGTWTAYSTVGKQKVADKSPGPIESVYEVSAGSTKIRFRSFLASKKAGESKQKIGRGGGGQLSEGYNKNVGSRQQVWNNPGPSY